MFASSSRRTQLRSLGCLHNVVWGTSFHMVSLCVCASVGSSTSSCLRRSCLELLVVISQSPEFVFVSKVCIPHAQCWFFFGSGCWCTLDLLFPGFEVDTDRLLQESVFLVGCVSAAWPISSTGIGMSGREGRGPEDRDDGRRSDRESEEENGLVAVEDHPAFDRLGAKWSAGELPLVPDLPRFGSHENDTDDEERPDNSENRFQNPQSCS